MKKTKISISIVDDHPIVIDGLQKILENNTELELLARYHSGRTLLEGLALSRPDILILDINLPDIPGDELITMILQDYPKMNVLVMSYLDNVYYVKTMIRLGALGYILKTCGKPVLIEAIKSVSRGDQYIDENIRSILVQQALVSKKESKGVSMLTRREKEILQLIASNLTSQQIAKKLFLSLKTVEFHRSNLLQKFSSKNAASLIKKAMELNLLDQ